MTPIALRTAPSRALALLGALALALALLALAPATATADQHDEGGGVTPARIDGENRFETAASISSATFDTTEVVHVVTGQNYPDALAASYAAGQVDGPVLLVARDGVPQPTWEELERLEAERVVIIGGQAAVSDAVQEELEQAGYDSAGWRISGDDRFATAAAVANTYGPEAVGTFEGDRTALLASGEAFADALSAGPLAAAANLPLLLTPTASDHAETNAALSGLGIERIIVIGGDGAVSSDVVEHYQDEGYEVERFSGVNRMDTARVVADNAIARFGFTYERTLLARGDAYPDALAASIHGGLLGAPILLTATPDALSTETRAWYTQACPEVDIIRALGGTGAVSTATLGEAVDAAEACEDGARNNQSYIIGPQEAIQGAAPGYEQEFHLIGTYDDGPMDVVELALFPCQSVQREGSYVTFVEDPDNPGYALGAGETDTGEAWISQINDVEQAEGQDRSRGFDPDEFNFHVQSNAPDCTLPVIWGIGEEDQPAELPIDGAGEPTVRFGVGQISWSAE